MSDVAIGAPAADAAPFRPLTVVLILATGILAFVGMLILGAFAPDLRSGHNGGAHALSNGATGYSALVALARETGRNPRIIRNDHDFDTEDLMVLTPETGTVNVSKPMAARAARPTLMVLPKWDTQADPDQTGWVREAGLTWSGSPEGVLNPDVKLRVARRRSGGKPLRAVPWAPAAMRFHAPRPLQTISGDGLKPLIVDEGGRAVLAQVGGRPLYILADPDLISNAGLADLGQARAALAMLDFLNSTGAKSVAFDVTLNGLGHARSPLQLAFEPPLLAMTLGLAAAAMLAAWQATTRFGSPRRRGRAIAFGKAALIDNSAALIRKAGREAALGHRYADMIRDRAGPMFGAPARLRDAELTGYLSRLKGRRRFSELVRDADEAHDRRELLASARALHDWLGEKPE